MTVKQVPTLVLIERPYVFSQRSPLVAREFVEHARARGHHLDMAQLEAFHQSGTLVPLFVSLESIARVGRSDERGDRQLQELRDGGKLIDPRDGAYRPWGYFHRRTAWATEATRSYWYSFYQLLALPDVDRLRQYLQPRPSARERRHHELALPAWYPAPVGERPDLGLVGLLTRLEPMYLPYVIQRLSLGLSADGTEGWLLLKAGEHPKVVQEILGHSSIAITLDLYSHVAPGMHDQAISRLDQALRDAQPDREGADD